MIVNLFGSVKVYFINGNGEKSHNDFISVTFVEGNVIRNWFQDFIPDKVSL